MSEALFDHIKKHIDIDKNEIASVLPYFNPLRVKKKQLLITEGKACRKNYFVVKGCLRMFFLDENGNEQTIQFALENWWMTDIDAFNKRRKASFSVQALEDTEVLEIDKDAMDSMLTEFPAMERYFRLIYERAYSASLFRVKYILRLSKEAFYELFTASYPDFIQRVPQKVLASFLGFTPEYLSELRKKQVQRKKDGQAI